jgi:putative transposase
MSHHDSDATTISAALELLTAHGFDDLARPLEMLFNAAMRLERSVYLGAGPFERSDERRGYANGFKPKTVASRLGELNLSIPKTRNVQDGVDPFYPKALERGERSEQALRLALAEMYVQGVSTRKVKAITEELCGMSISSTQVSRLAAELDEELDAWRQRPLGAVRYLVLDATYVKVRHAGSVMDCAILVAAGVREDGKRTVLGVSVSLSEAEVHWRGFLEGLLERGMHGVDLVTTDDHKGLRAALRAVLPSVAWQRCQVHLQRNAASYVPKVEMRPQVASHLRSIFNAPSREHAEVLLREVAGKYTESAPKLAAWIDENIREGLNVFGLPEHHRRRLRSSNMLERLNREIKRRTRVASLFPNEASALRLVTAVLAETSEEWETGRVYLSMDAT